MAFNPALEGILWNAAPEKRDGLKASNGSIPVISASGMANITATETP